MPDPRIEAAAAEMARWRGFAWEQGESDAPLAVKANWRILAEAALAAADGVTRQPPRPNANPVSDDTRARYPTLDRIWKHPQYEGKAVCSESFDLASRYDALRAAAPAPIVQPALDSFGEYDGRIYHVPSLVEALRPLAEYPVMESMRGREAWICRADAPNAQAKGIAVEDVFIARDALDAAGERSVTTPPQGEPDYTVPEGRVRTEGGW